MGPAREFSTGFYASLFAEMAASAVLALDAPAYDPAPFAAAGLVHLCLNPADDAAASFVAAAAAANVAADYGGGAGADDVDSSRQGRQLLSLHAMDRFAAVVDAAGGGPVAAHFAGGGGDPALREQAAGLVCAYLASRRLMGPREAAAWLCLTWPGPSPAAAATAAAAVADHTCSDGEGDECDGGDGDGRSAGAASLASDGAAATAGNSDPHGAAWPRGVSRAAAAAGVLDSDAGAVGRPATYSDEGSA